MGLKSIIKNIRWLYYLIQRRLRIKASSLLRSVKTPNLPENPDGKVYLHLGCGNVNSPEFINVDMLKASHVHYVNDVTELSFFKDDYADLIYGCHVLEHFRVNKIRKIFWEWKRVMKPGGTLRIAVPDFDKLLVIYKESRENIESILEPLMGYYEGYDTHMIVCNYKFFENLLEDAGFVNIRTWDPDKVEHHDFEDWASRGIMYNDKSYPFSLNIEADKA